MRQFWRWLRRSDLPADLLDGLAYTTFGLGDSSYAKFNWPAKKLHRRLELLGAQCFFEKGEADEQDYLGCVSSLYALVHQCEQDRTASTRVSSRGFEV